MIKRYKATLGILLTIAIVTCPASPVSFINISESAQAQSWHYVQSVFYGSPNGTVNCTNASNARFDPDDEFATAGIDSPPTLGRCVLDFGPNKGDWLVTGPGDDFTVFASSSESETYLVYVRGPDHVVFHSWGGNAADTGDESFDIEIDDGTEIRFIDILGETGSSRLDPHYGPEIDAVGWYG